MLLAAGELARQVVLAPVEPDGREQLTGAPALLFFCSIRRRHTRSDRDWSSDVCSSDLWSPTLTMTAFTAPALSTLISAASTTLVQTKTSMAHPISLTLMSNLLCDLDDARFHGLEPEIGRASCRERVEVSVVARALDRNW